MFKKSGSGSNLFLRGVGVLSSELMLHLLLQSIIPLGEGIDEL